MKLSGPTGIEPAKPVSKDPVKCPRDGDARTRSIGRERPPLVRNAEEEANVREFGQSRESAGHKSADSRAALGKAVKVVGPSGADFGPVPVREDTQIDRELAGQGALSELEVDDLARATREATKGAAAVEPEAVFLKCRDGYLAQSFIEG